MIKVSCARFSLHPYFLNPFFKYPAFQTRFFLLLLIAFTFNTLALEEFSHENRKSLRPRTRITTLLPSTVFTNRMNIILVYSFFRQTPIAILATEI